jgi:Tetratricopeptide repeat
VTRPYNHKKKIKAGEAAEKKIQDLLSMTKEDDFGELADELITLDTLVTNMQKAVCEPLLESLETIERRMCAYLKAVQGGGDVDNMNESTANVMGEHESQPDLRSVSDDDDEDEDDSGGGGRSGGGSGGRHDDDGTQLEENNPINQQHEQNSDRAAAVGDGGDGGPAGDARGGEELTAMQQRFMDRLNHFFDFQRIAEERTAIVDPQGKISSLKVKPHSKGIEEKDGTFKAGYRQQDIKGEPVRHMADLYNAAEEALPEFKLLIQSLVDAVPGLTDADVQVTPLKQRARASQKAQEEYTYRIPGPAEAWLYDIVRASVVCKSYKQMSDINKFLKESVHIVDCENRFAAPQFDGYRDIIYYISVPYKDELAFVCEIQVHHKEFKKHFGVNSHKASFRPYFAGPFRDPVETLRDFDMLLQVGRVDDSLMEYLLEANDSNQLKLFARIFFEQLDETDRSLELFKRVLAMEESSFGKGHVITASTYQYLGQILLQKGDADGALLYLTGTWLFS